MLEQSSRNKAKGERQKAKDKSEGAAAPRLNVSTFQSFRISMSMVLRSYDRAIMKFASIKMHVAGSKKDSGEFVIISYMLTPCLIKSHHIWNRTFRDPCSGAVIPA